MAVHAFSYVHPLIRSLCISLSLSLVHIPHLHTSDTNSTQFRGGCGLGDTHAYVCTTDESSEESSTNEHDMGVHFVRVINDLIL